MNTINQKIPFQDRWTVRRADSSGPTVPVSLPHTWNAEDGVTAAYLRCAHVYQRTWTADSAHRGQRLFLEFEAAQSVATVRVNGVTLTTHRGGFSLFRVEVTEVVRWEGENTLEVEVDNREIEEIYPLMADFTFFGGLYREVWLLVVPPVHFDLQDHGSSGVFLSQTEVGAAQAKVSCQAKVVNQSGQPQKTTCHFQVLTADGVPVAEAKQTAVVTQATSFLSGLTILQPHLWQGVADPYLYRVEVTLSVDNSVVDTRKHTLGLRHYEVDPAKGFFLNGIATPLRGVCRHQDKAGQGWAITRQDMDQDLALLTEIGANTVRLAHYQHHDWFLDLCDRTGLVVWAEIPFISRASKTDPTGENAVGQLVELIRQNYNHSSICFWGVQNEITIGGVPPELQQLVGRLAETAKREDPWRLTTQAQLGHYPVAGPLNPLTDVVAYNLYFGWYYKQAADFAPWLEAFRDEAPRLSLGVSEYGAEGLIAYHTDQPRAKDYTEEYHALYHETVYGIFEKNPQLWGTYVWNMFDFAAANRDEGGVKGMNNKGLVTHDRQTRKDAFWYYKAVWSAQPVVHLTSKRYVERTQESVDFKVYCNRPGLTLEVNGRTYAGELQGVVAVFRGVPLVWGDNIVVARCGQQTDSAVFRRVETNTVNYTCPDQGKGMAANWFTADVVFGEPGVLEYPAGFFSIRDSIEDILAVPAGERVLRKYLSRLFDHPMFTMAKAFTLEMVAGMDAKAFTPAVVYQINRDLNSVPKG